MAIINFTNVHYHIDDKKIIQDINLNTQTKRLGVIGRNGSGKTSFARLLSGLVAPTQGTVRIDDIDVAKDRRAALKQVGIVFQNPDHQILFPTVIEEIGFGLRQLGYTKSEAASKSEAILENFGLSHWRDSAVEPLSGGQKHLLCLIAVLVMQPSLLILDEPFVGLDIPTKMQLSHYLKDLPITLVQITHQCEDLQDYAEILWFDDGKVRMQGAPEQVFPAYEKSMTKQGRRNDLVDLAS